MNYYFGLKLYAVPMLWDLHIILSELCVNQTPDISMLLLLELGYGILCQVLLKLKSSFSTDLISY